MSNIQDFRYMIQKIMLESNPKDRTDLKSKLIKEIDEAIYWSVQNDCQNSHDILKANGFSRNQSFFDIWIYDKDPRFGILSHIYDKQSRYITTVRTDSNSDSFMEFNTTKDIKKAISAIQGYLDGLENLKLSTKSIGATITDYTISDYEHNLVMVMSYGQNIIKVKKYYDSWKIIYFDNTQQIILQCFNYKSLSEPTLVPRLINSDSESLVFKNFKLPYKNKNSLLHFVDADDDRIRFVGLCGNTDTSTVAMVTVSGGEPSNFSIVDSSGSDVISWRPTAQIKWAVADFINKK